MKSTKRLGGVGREESKVATNNEVEETDPEKVQVAVDGSNEEKGAREDTHTSADDAHDHLVTEFIILQHGGQGKEIYENTPNRTRETVAQGRNGADEGAEEIIRNEILSNELER